MTNFPAGFTDVPPDSNDIFLLDQKRKATGAAVKMLALPSGIIDASDQTALAGSLLESADATTGWTTTGTAGPTLDTAVKSQGTGSVKATLSYKNADTDQLYFTFTSPIAIGTHTLVAFDVYYTLPGSAISVRNNTNCKVADSTALGGNVNTAAFPQVGEAVWGSVILPLDGLTAIKSIGVDRLHIDDYPTPTNWRADVHMDNIRFLDETKLDAAISGSAAVAWVPPDYTPDADQLPLHLAAGKGLIDPAKGVYSKANNIIWLHDHLAHVIGGETGEYDISELLGRLIEGAETGQVIRGTPGATYRFDQGIGTNKDDIEIDFTGCILMLAYQENDAFFSVGGERQTIRGGWWLAYKPEFIHGVEMETQAGAPANSGTSKLLDAQNEEARLAYHTNWGAASHYSRHLPQQLGLPADGLAPRCYWSFTLSDSAQVANDCVFSVYDDADGTLLYSHTRTLTGTPTVYLYSYTPADIKTRLRVTLKKSTATANTITIASGTVYGESEYREAYALSPGLVLGGKHTTVEDIFFEGFGGDAIQCSSPDTQYVKVRRCKSYFCKRQGFSFNQGQDFDLEDLEVFAPGRSGIDFEPIDNTWFTRRVRLHNVVLDAVVNYGLAMSPWARNIDYDIANVTLVSGRLGLIFGGFRGGTMRNCNVMRAIGQGDYFLLGTDMVIENCVSRQVVTCGTSSIDLDDGSGTGLITYTPTNNVIRNLTTIYNSTLPEAWFVSAGDGYRLDGWTLATTEQSAFLTTAQAVPPGPLAYDGPYTDVFLGEYNRQLPGTFKARVAQSELWVPGGVRHYADPVYDVASLSGSASKGNNLRGVNAVVGASASSHAVAFPTKNIGTLVAAATAASNATAGSLANSTTYYYRIAPRGIVAGPAVYLAQISATTGASATATGLTINGCMDHANDFVIQGLTILRGTATGGPYTTRYDVIPTRMLAGFEPTGNVFIDLGTSLTGTHTGYPASFTATSGSWTGSVNESGYEPDATYAVMVDTNWATQTWVTNRATSGFTINFGTAAPGDGSGRVSWLLIR